MKEKILLSLTLVLYTFVFIFPTLGDNLELGPALEYLKTYKFGMERAPLQPIIDAVELTKNEPQKQEKLAQSLASILPSASIDGKRFIARQLAVIGTPSIVSKIVPLLQDENTIDIGCMVLEQIPGKEATEALINALEKLDKHSLKIALINSLGRRKDEKSVDILSKYLDSENRDLSNSALWALSEIPGEKSARVLWNWGQDKLGKGDKAIVEYLLRAADNLSKIREQGIEDLALSIYEAVYNQPGVASISKVSALQGIVELKGNESISLLEKNIFSGDKYLAPASVDILKNEKLDSEVVSRVIVSVISKVSASVQLALLEVISQRGLKSTLPEVIKLVESQTPEVKIKAINTMSRIGDVGSTDILMNLVMSGERDISESAEDALIKLSCEGMDKFLVSKAKQGSDEQRKLAVRLIGERRETKIKDLIVNFIKEGDAVVLAESLDTISIIGDEGELPLLFSQVAKDPAGASKYVSAITSILGKVEDEGNRVKYVVDIFNTAKSAEEKKVYINILGDLKSPEGYEFLKNLISKETELAPIILRALGKSEDVEILKYILSSLEGFKTAELKDAGVRSCLDILRSNVPLTELERTTYYIEIWKFTNGNANFQKNVLGNVAKLRRIESLDFVESIAPNSEIKSDWEVARITLARNLCFAYPERCIPLLESGLNIVKDKQKEEISSLLNGAKNRDSFICAWSVSGPYRLDDYSADRLFREVSLPPETEPSSVKDWRILPMKVRQDGVIYGDLFEQLGEGVECVAYVACKIKCSKALESTLLLGTNDGVKVWLNGKLVHSFPNGRIMTPEEDKVKLNLKEENVLLMAIYNQGGAWEFTAKLDGLDNKEIKVEPF
ncbi:MAG: HEAT repeat domain-containing protein [Candidatus Hydrogenedentes bacterium]|nr:HEAT repeat domain-containing protein [Candidatus Hydrogenedentota bacterium]